MTNEDRCLLRLCRAGLLGEAPGALPKDVDYARVMRLAREHRVGALTAKAALAYCPLNEDTREAAQTCLDTEFICEAAQGYEMTNLADAFEREGIDYCFLKGAYWRAAYPEPYLRDTHDLDILIRLDQWEAACAAVEARGFERSKEQEIELHATMYKGDVKLELHRSILSEYSPHRWYFGDVWDRLEPGGAPHCRRLSATDDELYMYLHAEKHMRSFYFMLRLFADIVVLRGARAGVDRARLAREAKRLGIVHFMANMDALAEAWIQDAPLTPKQAEMMEYLMSLPCLTEAERLHRRDGYWLAVNLRPGAMMRRVFVSGDVLKSRFENERGIDRIWAYVAANIDVFRMHWGIYRHTMRRVPYERRLALKRQSKLMYENPD